ncbi:MAG: putative OsmC-like protein/pimeloyl-ACP methyl ester carboxylesterase [Chlamydiales bacterium]|jgi:uncharacterized OsmC-like protein/pimeloyl-ACP methyl ester carboxylesterase
MPVRSDKITFRGHAGGELAGRLELPSGKPRAYALFAHCFTCSKDLPATVFISRALAQRGIAVLRFDFTGLGGSGGEFENTNFSSNVQDVVAAAKHLQSIGAGAAGPQMLIGHSLGGAAVLAAASHLPDVRAIATIGAPSQPDQVRKLLADNQGHARPDGSIAVQLGGRPFHIKKQFLDDLDQQDLDTDLAGLRRALLIFHSPVDKIVGIDNAERIYQAARGTKSFVSLEDADHLLSDRKDSEYVGEVLSAWASRYLMDNSEVEDATPRPKGEVLVRETGMPYTQDVLAGRHELTADEPLSVGGQDLGPDPYGYLLGSLGACTSMTVRMYADRKGWPVDGISVRLRHSKVHAKDCEECESTTGQVDRIERVLEIDGPLLSDEQRARLLEIADRCPVHRTLESETLIPTRLA